MVQGPAPRDLVWGSKPGPRPALSSTTLYGNTGSFNWYSGGRTILLRNIYGSLLVHDCFPLPDEERGLILDTECRPGSYLARVGRFMARFQFGSALLWVALELRCLRSCSTGHPAARPVRPLRLGWSRTHGASNKPQVMYSLDLEPASFHMAAAR